MITIVVILVSNNDNINYLKKRRRQRRQGRRRGGPEGRRPAQGPSGRRLLPRPSLQSPCVKFAEWPRKPDFYAPHWKMSCHRGEGSELLTAGQMGMAAQVSTPPTHSARSPRDEESRSITMNEQSCLKFSPKCLCHDLHLTPGSKIQGPPFVRENQPPENSSWLGVEPQNCQMLTWQIGRMSERFPQAQGAQFDSEGLEDRNHRSLWPRQAPQRFTAPGVWTHFSRIPENQPYRSQPKTNRALSSWKPTVPQPSHRWGWGWGDSTVCIIW